MRVWVKRLAVAVSAAALVVIGWSMVAGWQTERNGQAWGRNLAPLFDAELRAQDIAATQNLAAPRGMPWAKTTQNSGQLILVTPADQRAEAICFRRRGFIDRRTELAVIHSGYGASALFPVNWQIVPDWPVVTVWSIAAAALLLGVVRGFRRRARPLPKRSAWRS
jgi:hypothetical protein